MSMLQAALEPSTVVVAVDPGKVMNRVWVSDGPGWWRSRCRCRCLGPGSRVWSRWSRHALGHGQLVIAIEATGSLHRAWAAELERLHPGAVRLFAPSETKAARTQLGSGRFKTDDRDCAALTYLARRVLAGRRPRSSLSRTAAAVRHRRGLVAGPQEAQQRLHDQLNALCPGLSAPAGHGRALPIESADRPGGAGVRGRVRGPAAVGAVSDGPGAGPVHQGRPPSTGPAGGAAACRRRRTPSSGRRGWAGTWIATAACRTTSPPSRTRSRSCSPAPTGRS